MSPELLAVRKRIAERLAKDLAKETGLPVGAIMGRDHDPQVCRVRHRLWLLLHDLGMSMSAVGVVVGRDHSTIFAGVKKARARERLQQREVS